MTWTSYSDVESRWVGGEFPGDEPTVTTLIEDAEDLVLSAFPSIQDRIDNDELPINRVKRVVARVVIRHLRNPSGHRATTQGAGPYQQQVTFGGEEPGALYLTDADKADLAPKTSLRGKAYMVDMTPTGFNYQPDDFLWTPIQ